VSGVSDDSWPLTLDGSFHLNGFCALDGATVGAVDAPGQNQALPLDGSFSLSGSNTLDGLIG
jgi:hypothetical protein